MRFQKRKLAVLLSAFMLVSSVLSVPVTAGAVWIPNHTIPAYQQKNIFETETVKFEGISVEEVVNDSVSPMITRPIVEAVTFKIYNCTTQEVEQVVESQNGVLPALNLIKDHNYIFFAEDTDYRMPNAYVWVNDNRLVDIKHYQIEYEYPVLDGFRLYKRATAETNPSDDRRVTVNLPVLTEGGAPLYNVKIRLVSDVETLELNSGRNAKIVAELLEDVNYMIEVDHDTYDVASMPIAVKDKSEYGAGKYPYDHSDCGRVDNIVLVKKSNVHKNDSVITNTVYDEVYKDYYTNIAGTTTVTGMNFNDFIVLENKLNKSFSELNGKEYDVFDIKIVNPHRWEVAKLAAGEFMVTKLIAEDKQVSQVYMAKNNTLQKVEFAQSGKEVIFAMDSLSLYPVVIEYKAPEAVIHNVTSEIVDVSGDLATARVTVKGSLLPEELFYQIFYKQEVSNEPEVPAFDNTTLNVTVKDEEGNPVSGAALYLKYGTGRFGNVEIPITTDEDGKISYAIADLEDVLPDEEYELTLVENDNYTCEDGLILTFGEDDDWDLFLEYVGDDEYTESYGELVLGVKGGVSRTAVSTFARRTVDASYEWFAAGDYKRVVTEGTASERTFEVELPLSEYPEALAWTVKVASDKANANADNFVTSDNEMVISEYVDENAAALEALKEAVEEAEAYKESIKEEDYTEESWKDYSDAIDMAKALIGNEDAKKSDYDNAVEVLKNAKAGLKEKEGTVPDDGNNDNNQPGGGNETKPEGDETKPGTGEQKVPATGDTAMTVPFVISLLAAMAVIVGVLFKKRLAR